MRKIQEFIKGKRIYIYGAGAIGKTCKEYIESQKVDFGGYIVSDGYPIVDLNTYEYSQIRGELDNNCAILLAMSSDHQKQIIERNVFPCDYYCINDVDLLKVELEKFGIYDAQKNQFDKCYNSNTVIRNVIIADISYTYGDVIWNSAFLRELKRNLPYVNISLVINEKFRELFDYCPYIDKLFLYDKAERGRILSSSLIEDIEEFVKYELEDITYDVVFTLRHAPQNTADLWENIVLMQSINAKYRFGHIYMHSMIEEYEKNLFEPLYTKLNYEYEPAHLVLQKLSLLGLIGKKYERIDMEMWIGEENQNFAESFLECEKFRYIAIAPTGSTQNRKWDPKYFKEVISNLHRKYENMKFIILGGKDSVTIAQSIIDKKNPSVIDMTGKTTLLQAAAIVKKCILYIGVDTGLMQMASANGVPIVEISCVAEDTPKNFPGTAEWTGPWQVKNVILKPKQCIEGCKYVCRRESHCINQVKTEIVIKKTEQILNSR